MESIVFAKHKGNVISINESLKGKSCDCFCIGCGGELIAKQGSINSWHFAHVSNDCFITNESILHKIAKQIIKESGVKVPNLYSNYHLSESENHLFFDEYETEKIINDIVTDGLGTKNDKRYLIEVCVSHACDYDKIQKIKKINIPCLELYLSNSKEIKTTDDIKNAVLSSRTRWLLIPENVQKAVDYHNSKESNKNHFLMWKDKDDFIIGYSNKKELAIISKNKLIDGLFDLEIIGLEIKKEGITIKEATNKANEIIFNKKIEFNFFNRCFW